MRKLETVRKTAAMPECPFTEHRLRLMVAEGTCPGVRVGNRFLVNLDALIELVNAESRKAVGANG